MLKTACIWMANEIERRYGSKGLHGLSLMPGGIATGLQRYVDQETLKQWGSSEPAQKYGKSPAQGAATSMTAAFGKEWEGKGVCLSRGLPGSWAYSRRGYTSSRCCTTCF